MGQSKNDAQVQFQERVIRAALELFGRMEVADDIYEGSWAPSKNKHPRSDANQVIERKIKGGKST